MCATTIVRRANGFALIDLIFVIGMIGLLCSIAVPRLMMAKTSAGAASAIGSLRTIGSSQLTYALTCGAGFYAPSLTTLGTAPLGSEDAFISPTLGVADVVTRGNYVVTMYGTPFTGSPETCNGLAVGETAQGYAATADPAYPPFARYFAINANGVIFEDTASLDGVMPEIGDPPSGHQLR
jgi:type II secretory pathway pseudopilin PulG